jgi:hypothetical protein
MNNEPVAWMRLTGDRVTRISLEKVWDSDIPLYTAEQLHPAKTLTDEEIRKIHCITDGNLNMIEFARAILRKAQEK